MPAFGFSPMANTPILLHEHNEYLDVGVYLEVATNFSLKFPSFFFFGFVDSNFVF